MTKNSEHFLEKINWSKKVPQLQSLAVEFSFRRKKPKESLFCKQVHGNKILDVTKSNQHEFSLEYDGLFTTKNNSSLAIKTADCVPILLTNSKSEFVMALHCGWKGHVQKIIESGINQIRNLGFNSSITAIIGPSLCPKHFEVGPELIPHFKTLHSDFEMNLILKKGNEDKWHIDLWKSCSLVCKNLGILAENIHIYQSCTFCNPELWNSCRRDGVGFKSNWTTIRKRVDFK